MEVFSKPKASGLEPHRPYNCAIYLLPNTMLLHNRIYTLSLTEQQAMEDHIQKALQEE